MHTELAYWPALQTWQLVHTVLPVLDVYLPAVQDKHTVSLETLQEKPFQVGAMHAEDKYFPVPQTVQEVHRLLFVPVHIELAYSPAPQPVQVVHTVWLVAVHAEVKYWG